VAVVIFTHLSVRRFRLGLYVVVEHRVEKKQPMTADRIIKIEAASTSSPRYLKNKRPLARISRFRSMPKMAEPLGTALINAAIRESVRGTYQMISNPNVVIKAISAHFSQVGRRRKRPSKIVSMTWA
jgi:hypothetical protein